MTGPRETYDERRERERWDHSPDMERGPGHETDNEKLERWRRGWAVEDER